jgi:citrate lyase beta subunit
MSVNPLDISTPLLLLAPTDWPAAMRGDYSAMPLIFDLHPDDHAAASADTVKALLAFLQKHRKASGTFPAIVRVGGFKGGVAEDDLAALEGGNPDAILLSGCRNAADIQKLDVLLSVSEAKAVLPAGSTKILVECGAEAEFFLSPHSLAGKSARLRGLVFNGPALAEQTASNPHAQPEAAPLSFARAVCVLKAAEARVPCYKIASPESGLADIPNIRAKSMADGFKDIVVRKPAQGGLPTSTVV